MAPSIRRKATLAGLSLTGAAGILALTLAGPSLAFADPSASPSGSASSPAKVDHEAKRAQHQDALADALAKELGIDKAKVAAALEKAQASQQAAAKAERTAKFKERLDQAVKDGKLTQAEADAILKAAENGVLPGGGPVRMGGHGPK